MKLLGRDNDDADEPARPESADPPEQTPAPAGTTAPKGRPTPKRDTRRRGPVAPAPATAAEARKRRKELRSTMTKEERRAEKAKQRAATAQRRERMLAGEEAFLLPRDRGPVRRYVRDIVDSRRNILGLFLPAALFLIFASLFLPRLQYIVSPLMLFFLILMILDGILLGRRVNRAVETKFPGTTETGFKLGLYAAGRASQMRRMRIPRPAVPAGAKVV